MNSPSNPADDAVKAAPEHHKVLYENGTVRVLETPLGPGERTAIHSHSWPAALYILSWSDLLQYNPDGHIIFDTRTMPERPEPGSAIWTPPVPSHSVENIGSDNLLIIAVETKNS